jgi:hypothetical protein
LEPEILPPFAFPVVAAAAAAAAAPRRGGGDGVLATSRLGAARERVIRRRTLPLLLFALSFPTPPSEEAVGP